MYDVLVRVGRFIFLVDFVVLDCDVDVKAPIIIGILLLATGRALVEVEREDLKFWVNDEEVRFDICEMMKKHCNFQVNVVIDVIDQPMESLGDLE